MVSDPRGFVDSTLGCWTANSCCWLLDCRTFLNSGHSPSVLWFMLSLGSVSVWKTPAVLSLYMGCKQTPDASQKRTVPSSCLQTNTQQDIAQSCKEMSQWIFFFFKKGGAVPTLWAAGLSAEGPVQGSGLQLLATAVKDKGEMKDLRITPNICFLSRNKRTQGSSQSSIPQVINSLRHCTTGDRTVPRTVPSISATFRDLISHTSSYLAVKCRCDNSQSHFAWKK